MADNVFSSAQIRVEAETSKAEQALKDLRAKMDELGAAAQTLAEKQKQATDSAADMGRVTTALNEVKASLRDVNSLLTVLAKLEAPVRIARDFYQLGTEIEAVAEKLLGIPDVVGEAAKALANEGQSPANILRQQIKDLEKEWLSSNFWELYKNSWRKTFDGIFGTEFEAKRDAAKAKERDTLKRSLKNQEDDALKAEADLAAQKNLLATKKGEERIEIERQMEIDAAKKKYKQHAAAVIESINLRKDAELAANREIEAAREQMDKRREQRELDEIADRKNAYMDLINKTNEANAKIAEAAAKEMARALSGVASQFNSMFNLNQLTMTVNQLAANIEKIADQRKSAGL
jgi:hypothetical protein